MALQMNATTAPRPKPLLTRLGLALIGLAVAALVLGLARYYFLNSGPFDRPRFEAIVAQVRREELPAGQVREFKVENLADATTLRPLRQGEMLFDSDNVGHLWALRSSNGIYRVAVLTRDYGHFGRFGFANSDIPMRPEQDANGLWYLPDLIQIPINAASPDMKIDEHWWQVKSSGD
jgi:hypothetical protein